MKQNFAQNTFTLHTKTELSYRLQNVPSLHFSPQSLDSWECVRCDQALDQATTRHQFTRPGQRQAVARPA